MNNIDESDWLQVGTTFKPLAQVDCIIEPQIRKSRHKEKKKHKESTKQQQMVIKLSEEQVNAYYDDLISKKYHIDVSKGFIYKHDMGDDCLSLQLLPFGDDKIFMFGHMSEHIPEYWRAIPISTEQPQELQCIRYFNADPPTKSFIIQSIGAYTEGDFIGYSNKLIEYEKYTLEQPVVKRSQELQQQLQHDVNNIEIWKELLDIQQKIAILQQYNEPILLANRKLSIVQKLEQSSEILADHPWVLAYKISLMQDLELNDEEFHRQIDNLWIELFSKYVHIQPVWILYLDHKLKTHKFSSTMLRVEAATLFKQLRDLITEATRAQMIQFFKRTYIELLQQIAFYEYEMGFRERSIGILQGLCELNIFAPKQLQRTSDFNNKITCFREYWEQYTNLKTGESIASVGWMDSPQVDNDFIGQYETQQDEIQLDDPMQQYLQSQLMYKDRWRPANQKADEQWLLYNADSLVFYEDIEPFICIFNDNESKIQLINSLIQQLGFPSINPITLPTIHNVHSADMCMNGQLYDIDTNDLLIKYQALFNYSFDNGFKISKFMYLKRLITKLYDFIPDVNILLYLFVIHGVIYLADLTSTNPTLNNELQSSHNTMKLILKNTNNNLLLYVIYAEIQQIKEHKPQLKLLNQIAIYAQSNKQKLMILYTQFTKNIADYQQVLQLLSAYLYPNQEQAADNIIVLKIRNIYSQTNNKFDSIEKLSAYKKALHPFPLSKRAMLLIFLLYLEPHNVPEQLYILENEYKQLKSVLFQDQQQKSNVLTKYRNQLSLILLSLLRFTNDKQLLLQYAMQMDPDQLIFFTANIQWIGSQCLYFQRIHQLSGMQSPQKCWIAKILLNDPNKHWFVYEYLLEQGRKKLCTIYCEGRDQEGFMGMIHLKYNYVLDIMLIQIRVNPDIQATYRSLKRNPYSLEMHSMIVRQLEERKESLNLLNEIHEKELKIF